MKPVWYEKAEQILIRVEKDKIRKSPLGNEISVSFYIEDHHCIVTIPSEVLDEHKFTIPAVKVGEFGSNVLLSFPPTSLGTSTCSVPKSKVHTLLAHKLK